MKKLLLSLLIAPVLGFGQTNFCSGWDKGYQDGLNSCMKAGVSPICPIPPVGSDSYNDGYGLAYSKAKKKCNQNVSNNSGQISSTVPKLEVQKQDYGSYSNPKVYTPQSNASFAQGFNETIDLSKYENNDELFKAIPEIEFDHINNLNRYKYILIKDDQKHQKLFMKNYLKNKSNLPIFINIISTPLRENLELIATASVKSAVGMKGMYVNFSLNDSNGNQIYSKTGYSLLFGVAVKKIFKNLIANGGEAYNFDKSLGVQKTYIKTDNKKSEAIEELKKMKELLDLGLINKNEFDIKSKELKKIILGN